MWDLVDRNTDKAAGVPSKVRLGVYIYRFIKLVLHSLQNKYVVAKESIRFKLKDKSVINALSEQGKDHSLSHKFATVYVNVSGDRLAVTTLLNSGNCVTIYI